MNSVGRLQAVGERPAPVGEGGHESWGMDGPSPPVIVMPLGSVFSRTHVAIVAGGKASTGLRKRFRVKS